MNYFNKADYNIKIPIKRIHFLLDKNIIYDTIGKRIKIGAYMQLHYIQNKI